MSTLTLHTPHVSIELKTVTFDRLIIQRPDQATLDKTMNVAKTIFIEAFTTTYTGYHKASGSQESIESWLKLSEGLSINQWLSNVFASELEECKLGEKKFIHLLDSKGELLGWISHSPVSPQGDLYLSQCCLSSKWRNKRLATTVFSEVINKGRLSELFPEAKEVKLITRKINEAAKHLYTGAGFIMDETINPETYGESYNDRYVGFRLSIKK